MNQKEVPEKSQNSSLKEEFPKEEKSVSVEVNGNSSTINVTIHCKLVFSLDCFLIEQMVMVLWNHLKEVGRQILKGILEGLDAILMKEKAVDEDIVRSFDNRPLRTSFGDMTFRCHQTEKNGECSIPLLKVLGLAPRQKITGEWKILGILATLYATYRKALKIIGFTAAFSLAHLWRSVQKEGLLYRDKRERALYYYLECPPIWPYSERDFAILMMDGIWIRKKQKRKHLEVKVARLVVACKQKDGTYQFKPMQIYATTAKSAIFLKKVKNFFDMTAGLSQIKHILVLTDGCGWGRKFCEFYPEKAFFQLDWWHLWRYVNRGCKFEENLVKTVWELLRVEKLEEVLTLLNGYRRAMLSAEERLKMALKGIDFLGRFQVSYNKVQRKKLEELIRYIEHNKDGIYGAKALVKRIPGEYLVFGTGPVERLQAVMIGYRMKGQGKHWSEEGSENLISLLSRQWNGKEVEEVLQDCLNGLAEWEKLCEKPIFFSEEKPPRAIDPNGRKYSVYPYPTSSFFLVKKGKVEPLYKYFRFLQSINPLRI